MKALRNFLDKNVKPTFDKGGKLEKFLPAYDAIDTFLFVPAHGTHKGSHIRDGVDLKRTMAMVVLALLPCLIFGIWNTGHQHFIAKGEFLAVGDGLWEKFLFGLAKVLPILIVSYVVGLGIEFAFAVAHKKSVEEGFLVSGMLIPLTLPADIPLWMVAVATAFAVIIGKEIFGGTGMNLLNVALTARAFLFFAYPTFMSGDQVWVADTAFSGTVDAVSGATALGDAASKMPIDQFMQKYPLYDSFMGFIPGSIGETSVLACIIGAFILLVTGIASWRIMLSMTIGAFFMALLFNSLSDSFPENTLMKIDALHHLTLGSFAFACVYMATDPVTAAQTNIGKYIYGFLCGVMGIMVRIFNPAYPEGFMLAILFMNVMAPLIDHYVVEANINKRLKRLKMAKI